MNGFQIITKLNGSGCDELLLEAVQLGIIGSNKLVKWISSGNHVMETENKITSFLFHSCSHHQEEWKCKLKDIWKYKETVTKIQYIWRDNKTTAIHFHKKGRLGVFLFPMSIVKPFLYQPQISVYKALAEALNSKLTYILRKIH